MTALLLSILVTGQDSVSHKKEKSVPRSKVGDKNRQKMLSHTDYTKVFMFIKIKIFIGFIKIKIPPKIHIPVHACAHTDPRVWTEECNFISNYKGKETISLQNNKNPHTNKPETSHMLFMWDAPFACLKKNHGKWKNKIIRKKWIKT